MSGTRADRPQLAAVVEFAREGDVLVDRLARSMRQLLSTDIGHSSTCSQIPLVPSH